MNAKPCFWKAMAEGWGGDLWKERYGLLEEKKNPPKAREADFGRWKSGLSLGKEKPPKAREEDFHGGRSVMFGEKERGDLGKVSFRCGKRSALHVLAQHAASAGAARCVSWRSALRQPSHRTAFLASPFSFLSQGAIAFSAKRLSPPLPTRRTSSGGAVKRKPPLAPSLCGKFKRGLCFILSLCIHPLTFP